MLLFFFSGFQASRSLQAMTLFLNMKLPEDFQAIMTSFARMSSAEPIKSFVSQISDEWNTGAKHTSTQVKGEEHHIKIIIDDDIKQCCFDIGISSPLKNLFNDYAEKQHTSLRSFRFNYHGKPLFLSSIASSNKTPSDLGMQNGDVLRVFSSVDSVKEAHNNTNSSSPKRAKAKVHNRLKKKTKRQKKKSISRIESSSSLDKCRLDHSLKLTAIFEEAAPRFSKLRQKLNELSIDCQPPKDKVYRDEKLTNEAKSAVFNPVTSGVVGKAGKNRYFVRVGAVDNLYKTTKSSNYCQDTSFISCDLHGCTKAEACQKLNRNLEEWNEIAMYGSYPFVKTVEIICGSGSQTLSETVHDWIQEHDNISNVPKKLIPRRRFGAAA